MIKFIFHITLLFLITSATPSLNEIRSLYQKAGEDEKAFKELKSVLEKNASKSNLYSGYWGCVQMMEANYLTNPFSKLSAFNTGKTILEESIKKEPKQIELRYLRYTIQTKSPALLGYNKSIEKDKQFLINHYPMITDPVLKKNIKSFLKSSEYLNDSEKKSMDE